LLRSDSILELITTGSYQDKGKLVIDEEKLRAALTDNYDAVVQLFTQGSQIHTARL